MCQAVGRIQWAIDTLVVRVSQLQINSSSVNCKGHRSIHTTSTKTSMNSKYPLKTALTSGHSTVLKQQKIFKSAQTKQKRGGGSGDYANTQFPLPK